MKNMKIQARLLLSYGIIIALLLVISISSIVMLSQVGKSLSDFHSTQFQTVHYSWTARRSTYAVRAAVLQAIVDPDRQTTTEAINTARTEYQTIKDCVSTLRTTYKGHQNDLDTLEQSLATATPVFENILSLAQNNQSQKAYEVMKSEYIPAMNQIRTALSKISTTADESALARVDQGTALTRVSTLITSVLSVVSIAVSIFLATKISRGIRLPIMEIREASMNIAKGQLATDIQYQSRDELGELADSMRESMEIQSTYMGDLSVIMAALGRGDLTVYPKVEYVGDFVALKNSINTLMGALNNTLTQINQAADQVSSGSDQVSAGAQALSQGATEQASSVEELAATINEISRHIQSMAEDAQVAKNENVNSHNEIQVCSQQMEDLVKAMDNISQKSNEINKIIKNIEDIAFQTNILALNAAVEAARAGAAGKGFAVVADEVRNLAGKSAEAAKNTTALIEETVSAVAEGSRLSTETEASLAKVVENSQKVLDAVINISQASEEQARAVSQVTVGIDQISSVVQTNSATAEESAAASEELSSQAQVLKRLVGQFKLAEEDSNGAGLAALPADIY